MILGLVACHAEPPRVIAEPFHGEVAKHEQILEASRGKRSDSISEDDWTRQHSECEAGQRRACGPIGLVPGHPIMMRCIAWADGTNHFDHSPCNTPLAIAWNEAPVVFTQPSIDFPIGEATRTEWISADSPWLALDRDGSGCIESSEELFAGFSTLTPYDDNGDGLIDKNDAIFAELVLWSDGNQDKQCERTELEPLKEAGIESIDLHFVDHEQSQPGSYEGETSSVNASRSARIVDVHLEPF